MRILIVDDDPTILNMLARLVEREGYEGRTCSTGAEAVEVCGEFRPDLIIMDVVMPGLNGYETTREIKKISGCQDVPVIFLTGTKEQDLKAQAFSAGAIMVVRKPMSTKQLIDVLKLTLESGRQGGVRA